MDSVEVRVRRLIAGLQGVPESKITASSVFKDMKMDSLDVAELVIAMEIEFGLDKIPDDQFGDVLMSLRTVSDVVKLLAAKGIR